MDKKKVLLMSGLSMGGGAEKILTILANNFYKRGYDVTFSSFIDNGYYDLDSNVKKVVFAGNGFLKDIKLLRKNIKNNNYDFVIAFMYPIAIKLHLSLIGLKNKPIVISSERADPARTKSKYKILRKWAYRKSNAVVFQTKDALEYFPNSIKKIGTIIENPISDNLPMPFNGEIKHRIIGIGRLTEQKNFKMLILAFIQLHKKYNDFVLEIYGEGSMKDELNSLIEEHDMKSYIFLKGFSNNIHNEILDAYMYVSSSNYEGISNTMLEAICIGLPSICTDCPVGGARQSIIDGENGLLIPTNDEKSLYDAMERLILDKNLYNKIKSNYFLLKDKISSKKIVDKWEELLNNLK